MSLFSKFFKKSQKYIPVNRLEALMNDAAVNPAMRPEFYRNLFHFDLFCLGESESIDGGETKTAKFQTVLIDGVSVVLAFTSKEALSWYVTQKKLGNLSYIGFRSHVLFQMLENKMGIILNPGHEFSKHFAPQEISEILKGINLNESKEVMPAGEQFSIGIPANPPLPLIQTLANYLRKSKKLKDIYFGLLRNQKGELRYLAALEFQSEISSVEHDQILGDLILISREVLSSEQPLDFCKLKDSGFEKAIEDRAMISVLSYF